MEENLEFLKNINEAIVEIMRPFKKQQNQRQKMLDFVQLCIRYVEKDDFLGLDELLRNGIINNVVEEPGLNELMDLFSQLKTYSTEKVERYRLNFIEDMLACAREADIPLQIDFPRFEVVKGIDGNFNFSDRSTTINNKTVKSINPQRVIVAISSTIGKLYDESYDPNVFIDSLYQVYKDILKKENKPLGEAISMQLFYLEYVLSLQPKSFFQNMDKGKFRSYEADKFAVEIWRYFQSGIGSNKPSIQLRPGRNNALWLLDNDGQRRQITTISFQENK